MTRTIYNYQCRHCGTHNRSQTPYPVITAGNRLHAVFCPHCGDWTSVKHTDLSPDRYRLSHRGGWHVIDEDSPERKIVYSARRHASAKAAANYLNAASLALDVLPAEEPPCRR